MMVLDRMHEICDEQNIDGDDRVRRLLMAVSHDIGKPIKMNSLGGVHADDEPTHFGGHDEIGADAMEHMALRMGLDPELRDVMMDACRYHMDFHDLPQMSESELLDFIGDEFPHGVDADGLRELPTTDGEPNSFYGATAWELLDTAHADHEGRFEVVADTVQRPEFDREPFEKRIEAVFEVQAEVDGYEALETGLCDDHNECPIDRTTGTFETDGRTVQSVMSACPSCRTPGDWIGTTKEQMVLDRLSERLN
jgi:hypothetical protein